MKVQFLSLCIRASALFALLASQAFASSQEIQGERVTQYREQIKTTAEIMFEEAVRQETGGDSKTLSFNPSMHRRDVKEVLENLGIERKNHPDSPKISAWSSRLKVQSGGPFLPPGTNNTTTSKLGISFTASTFSDVPQPGVFVHDTMGALGPEQYIVALNAAIRSFHVDRKTGVAEPDDILETQLATFMNISEETSGEGNSIIADPIIRYDTFSKRWYVICLSFPERGFVGEAILANTFICLAVSDGPVITACTKWRILQIPHNQVPGPDGQDGDFGGFFDFPTMGIDKHAVYIGANIFNAAPAGFDSTVYVVQKKSLLDETKPLVITAFRNLADRNPTSGMVSPTGIDNFDPDPEFGYILGEDRRSFGVLPLRRIINPGSTNPTISPNIAIVVPSTSGAPDFSYKGNFAGFFAESGGLSRIHQGVVRNGKLFANFLSIGVDRFGVANASSADDRNAIRWHELDLKGNDVVEGPNTVPTIVQVGTVWDPTDTPDPLHFVFGSLMTTPNGDLTICATQSSALVTPNAVTFRRKASDPLCTIGPKQMLTTSEELFNIGVLNGQFVRWGDYSNTSPDPESDNDHWTIQEFVSGYGNFAMHVRQLVPNN